MPRRVKLLLAGPTQGSYGGLEAFVTTLARAIASWPEFDLRVCWKVVKGRSVEEALRKVTSALPCPATFVRSGAGELMRHILWADLVHGQNTSPDIVLPARLLNKKVVLTIHNWRHRGPGLLLKLWGLSARLAHRRWYNSGFVWDTWEPDGRRQGSERVPTVCGLPDCWRPPGERRGFLFMGRWIANKGIDDLVRAYAAARLDPEAWPLLLLGDGPLRGEIQRLVAELGVAGVRMPGFVDDAAKAPLLASARWLVAPPRTREDLGLTPIEARNVGVPVIITRDGGLPEAGGDAALVAEPGDVEGLTACLLRAAAMPEEEYRARGERGRETLRDFLRPLEFYRASYLEVLGRR